MRTSLFAIATTLAAFMASTTNAVDIGADVEKMDNLDFSADYNFAELDLESSEEDDEPKAADIDKAIEDGKKSTVKSLQDRG